MFETLKKIFQNRAKVGLVNFLLEMTIGILTEWQRANRDGNLDFHKKQDTLQRVDNNQTVDFEQFKK